MRDQYAFDVLGNSHQYQHNESLNFDDSTLAYEGGANDNNEARRQSVYGGPDAMDKSKKGRKMKPGTNEDLERRKKKALYGSRASSKIFESASCNNNPNWVSGEN